MSLGLTALKRSFGQLRSNPLRTMLTLLGVVFGVGAVVAMMSIGEGAQRDILARIEAMGATSVHVQSRAVPDGELAKIINDSVGLSRQDVEVIRRALPQAKRIGTRARHDLAISDLPMPPHELQVLGVNPELMAVHALRLAQGRGIRAIDQHHGLRVAVIGPEIAQRAFPKGAIGQVIRLDYAYFTIVGVLASHELAPQGQGLSAAAQDTSSDTTKARGAGSSSSPASSSGGFDANSYARAVLIPHETMLQELHPGKIHHELDMISVEVESTAQTLTMKRELDAVLSSLHGGVQDFEITAPEEILRQKQETQAVFNAVLIAIAAISLLVGGIGVMNIMLANIMERVSEIGLRRAIGATRRDIRNQFLLESVSICFVGGLLGVAFGLATSFAVSHFIGMSAAFAWESTALAFGISLLTGVSFGLMPAVRAANINPIDALRGDS